jgi:stage IV sporulation protein FB
VLVDPGRTSYDLSFRLFGFPVRVHPFFWLVAALLGGDYVLRAGVVYMLIWIAVVFVSILVHELGHALAFRRFGTDAQIVLYAFGGLAIPYSDVSGRWRRIVVALAGPFAGFVLFGVVVGSNRLYPWAAEHPYLLRTFLFLWFINLYWGIFNLLPVMPLDGGRVSEELCSMASRRNGRRIALEISIAVAGLVCLYSLACELDWRQGGGWFNALPWWFPRGTFWTAILFGLLAVESWQMLQQRHWTEAHWREDDPPPWKG